jgi:hypothetical protein
MPAVGTGAAATAGAAGTVAAAPVLAAIAGGVLLVAAGAWVVTPEPQRAALLKQTLATARGMLQAAGLAPEQINGHLRQIDRAFRNGKSAVDALVNQWRNAETAPQQAPARSRQSRVQPTGGALGNRSARPSPHGPNGPQRPAASAPPLRSSAPQLSAADQRTLQGLHTQVEALQAQAGRVLTAEQLADGSLLKQLAQIKNSAATLRHPGAQAHRGELTALLEQARQAVARRYRLTANKAVAGLLTTASAAGRQVRAQANGAAPHAAQPYSAPVLQQLLTQARQLLTAGADAPLLAELQQWLAQRQAAAPVLDGPGLGQSRQPATAAPAPPGRRSTITHTNTASGAVTGDAAQALEQKAAQKRAKILERATDEARRQKNLPFNQLSDAQIVADVASRFGVSAAEVMSALANRDNGPRGAQGGARSSAVQGMGGAALASSGGGATSASNPIDLAVANARDQLSDSPVLRQMSQGNLTPQQWNEWAVNRYSLAQGLFQNLLEECIAAATKLMNSFPTGSPQWQAAKDLATNLGLNLTDELGGWPNPDALYSLASHDTWRQNAYEALAIELRRFGFGDPRQSTSSNAGAGERLSDAFANRVKEMIANARAPNATPEDYYRLIALFAGVEAGIPAEYSQVLPGLARDFHGSFGDPSRSDLPGWARATRNYRRMYFADHINHDRDLHLPGITSPLNRLLVDSPKLQTIVINEIRAITHAKYKFYEKLGEQTGIGLASE